MFWVLPLVSLVIAAAIVGFRWQESRGRAHLSPCPAPLLLGITANTVTTNIQTELSDEGAQALYLAREELARLSNFTAIQRQAVCYHFNLVRSPHSREITVRLTSHAARDDHPSGRRAPCPHARPVIFVFDRSTWDVLRIAFPES